MFGIINDTIMWEIELMINSVEYIKSKCKKNLLQPALIVFHEKCPRSPFTN